jgi:hypothetical protein
VDPLLYFSTGWTFTAGISFDMTALDRHGKAKGRMHFPDTPGTSEKISMGDPVMRKLPL